MGNVFYFSWEPALMIMLQHAMGSAGGAVASFLTLFGEETILILILGFLYWCYDKELGRTIGISILAGTCINPMIKCIVLRIRPYMVHPEIICLKPVDSGADIFVISAQGYSFPSGHSMNAAIMYGSLPVCIKERSGQVPAVFKAAAFLLPLLVGFSRVLLGNHYPTDVLFGWLCGALVIFIYAKLRCMVKHEWQLWIGTAFCAAPGLFYCRTADYFTAFGLLLGFIAAMFFEQRFVGFRPTRQPLRILIRVIGGLIVYLILNTALKLPFSPEFLSSGTLAALFVRLVRYMIVAFAMLGLYPLLFDLKERRQKKD